MDFPKGYIQERTEYRTNEAERKLYNFLKDFFSGVYSKVESSIRYYLFGKETIHYSDKVQIAESLQVSNHSASATINLLRTQGTASAYSGTVAGTIGGLYGLGYNGTNFITSAGIQFISTDTWTGSTNGTYINFRTTPAGTSAAQDSGHIASSGSWASGKGSLATTATTGFLYIPTCAGVPTGVPESISGRIALVADTSGGKIYAYLGGWTALN